MRSGRWAPGWRHTEAGLSFRVVEGKKDRDKGSDDMRLEWYVGGQGWIPVTMAAAYILVDFFAENEDALTPYRPHWRVQGGDYFMRSLEVARREGWEHAERRLVDEPRARLSTAVVDEIGWTDDAARREWG